MDPAALQRRLAQALAEEAQAAAERFVPGGEAHTAGSASGPAAHTAGPPQSAAAAAAEGTTRRGRRRESAQAPSSPRGLGSHRALRRPARSAATRTAGGGGAPEAVPEAVPDPEAAVERAFNAAVRRYNRAVAPPAGAAAVLPLFPPMPKSNRAGADAKLNGKKLQDGLAALGRAMRRTSPRQAGRKATAAVRELLHPRFVAFVNRQFDAWEERNAALVPAFSPDNPAPPDPRRMHSELVDDREMVKEIMDDPQSPWAQEIHGSAEQERLEREHSAAVSPLMKNILLFLQRYSRARAQAIGAHGPAVAQVLPDVSQVLNSRVSAANLIYSDDFWTRLQEPFRPEDRRLARAMGLVEQNEGGGEAKAQEWEWEEEEDEGDADDGRMPGYTDAATEFRSLANDVAYLVELRELAARGILEPPDNPAKRSRGRRAAPDGAGAGAAADGAAKTRRTQGAAKRVFVVEAIVGHRDGAKDAGREYRVKWDGYPHEENTWEPAWRLREDVPRLVEDYERRLGEGEREGTEGK